MQTLTPDSFCPLTDPQPYQRDRDERRPPTPRMARPEQVLATRNGGLKPGGRSLHRLINVFVLLEGCNQATTRVTPANSRIRQLKDRQTDVAGGMAKSTHEIFQHDSLRFIIERRKHPEW